MNKDLYAVIGNPIAHSKSPSIHARFAEATGESIEYGRLLAPPDGFAEAVRRFREQGGRGLNVTLPFKLDAFALASRRSARAEAAGAVNLLAFEGEEIRGDNTDGAGLVFDIEQRLALPLAGCSVLLLGAGGAARGVVGPLLDAGVAQLTVANRSAARAEALVRDIQGLREGRASEARLDEVLPNEAPPSGTSSSEAGQCAAPRSESGLRGGGFGIVQEVLASGERFDLLINATSTGLAAESLPLPPAVFASARLAYDMVYAAQPTPFMQQASQAGCAAVSDGLGMLVEQAAESFLIWRGIRPDSAPVYAALRAELAGSSTR
jgi:shikimate dehydrogenase